MLFFCGDINKQSSRTSSFLNHWSYFWNCAADFWQLQSDDVLPEIVMEEQLINPRSESKPINQRNFVLDLHFVLPCRAYFPGISSLEIFLGCFLWSDIFKNAFSLFFSSLKLKASTDALTFSCVIPHFVPHDLLRIASHGSRLPCSSRERTLDHYAVD